MKHNVTFHTAEYVTLDGIPFGAIPI